jgi:glycerol uptake facilitator-like aquaporin
MKRALVAEALGSAILSVTVIGSGIAAEQLAGGNAAIALLANSLATAAILPVIIILFANTSGAHFNPAVSLAFAVRRELSWPAFAAYAAVQTAAMIAGAVLAHLMFDLPALQQSTKIRASLGLTAAELVAAFGLVLTILGCKVEKPAAIPYAVGLYIGAAYWFTASTSFANPAITIARAFTDTFAGIAPQSAPLFIAAQLIGALLAVAAAGYFWPGQVRSGTRRRR